MFAEQMLSLLARERVILNFDESLIEGSAGKRRSWCAKGMRAARHYRSSIHGISLMLTISSRGERFFQFLQGNNNEASVSSYLVALCESLN